MNRGDNPRRFIENAARIASIRVLALRPFFQRCLRRGTAEGQIGPADTWGRRAGGRACDGGADPSVICAGCSNRGRRALVRPAAWAGDSLAYIPGSTVKLEQLIGDFDRERQAPTANLTGKRYGIEGTDLGYSFEHRGKLVFLFGDTVGKYGGDVAATSTTTDPEAGLHLDFLTDASGKYLRVKPPGVKMAGFEVPD